MIVIYYYQDTGMASHLLAAPDLGSFPYPDTGMLALILTEVVQLPGYVVGSEYFQLPEKPSQHHTFNWQTKEWEDPRSVTDAIAPALDRVDQLAGKARLRYITSVPGQAETYQKKEEQARTWAATGFVGDAPSFISAEATALGRTPQSVATEIIGLADYWANSKGPQIEACRRKWKVAVESATSVIQVDNLIIQAIAELDSL